jgi:hypothetical protein
MHAARTRCVKRYLSGSKGGKGQPRDSEGLQRTLRWVAADLWAEGATMPCAFVAARPAHRPAGFTTRGPP